MFRSVLLATLALSAAHAATPSASSEYRDDEGERFPAANAFDGRMTTAWFEGEISEEDGRWIELRFDRETEIHSVSIWPGDLSRGTRSLRETTRPAAVTVTLIASDGTEVTDSRRLVDVALDRPDRIDIPVEGPARTVRVAIDEIYEGPVNRRLAIAEIGFNVTDEAPVPGSDRLQEWLGSTAGTRAAERDAEDFAELLEAMALPETAEEPTEDQLEEAREAEASLRERAAEGAPYLQAQVRRYVPQGFWTQAIPPQAEAVEQLYSLLDPSVIPSLELAAVRSTGTEARRLWAGVEKYQALAQLRGGVRRNVPAWGQEGWSPGQFQAFGEPMQLEVDQLGLVYVADPANNRVQRFNRSGQVEQTWGAGEPGVGNEWIGGSRRYYPQGSAAGTGSGVFTTALDVTILPGKEADGFAAIDGVGQVQVFDAEGNFVRSWRIPTQGRISPRLGGQVYLEYSKNKLVAIWGDHGYVFNLEGDNLSDFTLEDGTPSGAMVLKNGKLGLVYPDGLIMYSLDGFRHGTIMGPELEQGYEYWDVAFDENKTLWAVTDTGWIYQFKKPGKELFRWQFNDAAMTAPRLDVHEGRAYISQGNRIVVVDVAEEMARREAEAAE